GMHKFENSLLYSTEPDLDLSDANLFDVTPTVLDLLDVEYNAQQFDGNSLA
ncbi:nucleotide pyrophosphatase, partial [Halorubrum sp. SP3]